MPYKLNPDHTYIVVFLFFLAGASVKFAVEQLAGTSELAPQSRVESMEMAAE